MVLTSLLDNKQYFWIKVPRTATQAFSKFFTLYVPKEPGIPDDIHSHFSYLELKEMYQQQLPAVSVVRHPVSRFKSIIYYLADRHPNTQSSAKLLWESTESCVNFLNTVLDRNCELKGASISSIFLDTDVTEVTPIRNFINATASFFKTQAEYAYHPKVKIFHYEKLNEFIEWIDTSLGYDTSKIHRFNASVESTQINVDFNHPEFVKTIENLYYIDYKVFGYPLRYLL
jgi:hypothetical protein